MAQSAEGIQRRAKALGEIWVGLSSEKWVSNKHVMSTCS